MDVVYTNSLPTFTAEAPPVSVTVIVTGALACAGDTAVMEVELFTVTLVAGIPPKVTVDVAVKPEPVIVTVVPPAVPPLLGVSELTVGAMSGATVKAATDVAQWLKVVCAQVVVTVVDVPLSK